MYDVIGVEKRECFGDIMAQIDLDVIWQRLSMTSEKIGQVIIHQLHQNHRQPSGRIIVKCKKLYYIWVSHQTQKFTLELKPPARLPVKASLGCTGLASGVNKSGMEDLSSTGEVITLGLTNSSI